jgi:hypothetical protein
MPWSKLIRPAVVLTLSAATAAGAFAAANAKPANGSNGNNKAADAPAKPDPIVIRFESAQKQRVMGTEVMVVSGTDAVTGAPRQFPVENQAPQDKSKVAKYDPKKGVADTVNAMKPGELLKAEFKLGGYKNDVVWLEKAEKYDALEHEEEPGVYQFFEAFKDTVGGEDVYKVKLTKFGTYIECLAPMVPAEDGKGKVPDPQIVAAAEGIKRKTMVEATVAPRGANPLITTLDPYQAKKSGTFGKLVEADVAGQKGQAVEMTVDGKTETLPVPGKLVNKRWVSDAGVLAEVRKVRPGMPVLYRTREVDGKTYVRQIAAAPKEVAKTPAKAGGSEAMMPAKSGKDGDKKEPEKKDGKKK